MDKSVRNQYIVHLSIYFVLFCLILSLEKNKTRIVSFVNFVSSISTFSVFFIPKQFTVYFFVFNFKEDNLGGHCSYIPCTVVLSYFSYPRYMSNF